MGGRERERKTVGSILFTARVNRKSPVESSRKSETAEVCRTLAEATFAEQRETSEQMEICTAIRWRGYSRWEKGVGGG